MSSLGYVRVSTTRQVLDQQRDALEQAGVERIFEDKITGAHNNRPGFIELLDYARTGDSVTVTALDRLGRSLSGVISTIELLQGRGIIVRSLRENIDFGTASGKMIAGIFATLAEYERTLINERAAAAREAARLRGRPVGRKRTVDTVKLDQAVILRGAGQTMAEVCSSLGVARATLYRALQERGQVADAS